MLKCFYSSVTYFKRCRFFAECELLRARFHYSYFLSYRLMFNVMKCTVFCLEAQNVCVCVCIYIYIYIYVYIMLDGWQTLWSVRIYIKNWGVDRLIYYG